LIQPLRLPSIPGRSEKVLINKLIFFILPLAHLRQISVPQVALALIAFVKGGMRGSQRMLPMRAAGGNPRARRMPRATCQLAWHDDIDLF
jgi:hypothetical protein